MVASTKTGVPGIPQSALDAITDVNARMVLQAIVDGWNVRNGNSGTGDNAFVTKGELDYATAQSTSQVNQALTSFKLSPGDINQAISDLHTQVFESLLFKALETRVDLIDAPGGIFDRLGATELVLKNEITQRISGDTGITTSLSALGTRVGTAEAGLLTEITQRVNADNAIQTNTQTQYSQVTSSLALVQNQTTTNANAVAALSSQMTQLQASVAGAYAAINEESLVRANADGDLYGQYTLRIDINGRVSGFGLAASPTVSDFIVRADRFSIVSPDGQNKAAVIMTNNTISVYDENASLRVRIGNLG